MTIDDGAPPTLAAREGSEDLAHQHDRESGLRGNLGTASLVFTVIAYNEPLIVLGGILPLIIASGNGLGAPGAFIALGLLVMIFAVGLNAMAVRMSHAGAFYTYVTAGLGRAPGLSAGILAIAAYVTLCAGNFALFATSTQHLFSDVFGVNLVLPWPVWALIAWVAVSTLSLFNIELSAKVLGVASACEIVLTVIWNFRVYVNGGPEGRSVDIAGHLFSGSPAFALVLGILCLTGFESLQVFRSETKDAHRTVPRATYISVVLLAVMYASSTLAYIISYGASKAIEAPGTDPTGSVLASISHYVAKPAADIANVLLTSSIFVACLAITNILARYLFALGRDGVLPAVLGKANAKHGSPMAASGVAALINIVVTMLIVVTGFDAVAGFAVLTSFGAYCLMLLYFVTSLAIVVFFARRREPGTNKLQVFVAPLVSTLGMLIIAYLATVNFAAVIGQTQLVANVCLVVIVAMILAGFLAGLWFRSNRPDVYERIGNQKEVL